MVRQLFTLCLAAALSSRSLAATDNYFGTSGTVTGNVWSTSTGGPYTSAFDTTGGGVMNFGNAATVTGASITIAGINATANTTWTAGGTISNVSNGVIPISVASGVTLNLGNQALTSAAGGGYIKNGEGVLFTSNGSTYGGGFTLNAGTVVIGGVNALGGAATNTLALNGGIIASNNTISLAGKFNGGITIGGNVQFGDTVGLASSTAGLSFFNAISLGSVNRTLTLGNGGAMQLGGVISNTGSNGITFDANSNGTGVFIIANNANTFTGAITIKGGRVLFNEGGSLGNAANKISLEGGTLSSNTLPLTIATSHAIEVDASATNAINADSASITYDGVIAEKTGTTGTFSKTGFGNLTLGGMSTYTGATSIKRGALILSTGANRLPTGTTLNLGQAASSNLGTLNLNGQHQEIAGLNSISGTNNSANNNTVTSSAAATLTLSGSGTYSYGAGTNANSGVITGAIAVVKSGTGTQTLGDANTYTGSTTVSNGTLIAAANDALGTTAGSTSITSGATLGFQGGIAYATAEAVSIAGDGFGGVGAINNVSGNNSFAGAVTMTANSSIGSASGTLVQSSAIGETGGARQLTKVGDGTLAVSAANTYTGATIISGGSLSLGNGGATGSLAPSSAITNNGNLTINRFGTITQGTDFSGSGIVGTGSLTKSGTGNLVLNVANSYSGATTINNGGAIFVSSNDALGTTAGSTTIANGGTLGFQGNVNYTSAESITVTGLGASGFGAISNQSGTNSFAGDIAMTGGAYFGSLSGTLTLSGVVSGTGPLTKSVSGTIVLANANSYSGLTMIVGGTLVAASNDALGTTAGTTMVNANTTLGFQGGINYATAEAVTLNGTGVANSGAINNLSDDNLFAGNITLQTSSSIGAATGTTLTLSGEVTGTSAQLTKVGAGTVELTRAAGSSYTGGTTVSGGTLLANNTPGGGSSATGSGNVTVATGGTLGGTGAVSGAVTVQDGGTLAPGASIESLNTGALSFNSGSTFAYEFNSSGTPTADLLNSSGTLAIASGAKITFDDLAVTDVTMSLGTKFTLIRYDAGTLPANVNPFTYGVTTLGDLSTFTVGANSFLIKYFDTTAGSNFFSETSPGLFVTITAVAVPEASAFLFGGLIAGAICLWKWHQKRQLEKVLV